MEDEEVQTFIGELQGRLRSLHEAELADQDAYIKEDPEGGRRRLPPRETLAQMIEALERTILLDDVTTYKKSVDLIVRATDGKSLQVRVVPYDEATGESGQPFNFSHLRDLSDLRARLRRVAVAVRTRDTGVLGADE